MEDTQRKQLSMACAVAGGVLTLVALVMCFKAAPIRPRNVEGILLARGGFLLIGLLLVALAFYFYPTVKKHRSIINVLFLLPIMIPFVMVVILPFLLGIFYSFTDWNGFRFHKFVGLANYMGFFKAPDYINSFFMTVLFCVINVILVNVIAFGMSLLVTQKLKGANVYRAGFFIPNLIGGIVLGYVWQFIFNYVFITMGKWVGLSSVQSMLNTPASALFAMVLVSTWQYAGYIMMIYVTALQGISDQVLEAAKIDGASGWRRMTDVIVPMIAHAFTICIFLTLVNSFKQFDVNLSLTDGGPSTMLMGRAIKSTELQALNIYKTAIVRNYWAVAQAKSVVFFIVLAAVSMVQVTINKKREENV